MSLSISVKSIENIDQVHDKSENGTFAVRASANIYEVQSILLRKIETTLFESERK